MSKRKQTKKTSDGLAILAAITGNDPEMRELIVEEEGKLRMARALYELRKQAGLSQAELARRIGTTQSVISRLEDADYDSRSLPILQRIAAALDQRIEIRFIPACGRLEYA